MKYIVQTIDYESVKPVWESDTPNWVDKVEAEDLAKAREYQSFYTAEGHQTRIISEHENGYRDAVVGERDMTRTLMELPLMTRDDPGPDLDDYTTRLREYLQATTDLSKVVAEALDQARKITNDGSRSRIDDTMPDMQPYLDRFNAAVRRLGTFKIYEGD